MRTHKTCLICDSKYLINLRGYEENSIVRCGKCAFVFSKYVPTEEEIIRYYSQYSYSSVPNVHPITIKRYHQLLEEFEPYRKNNLILDIGCGIGSFLSVAKERGWDVFGTEISKRAIEILREKGVEVYQGRMDKLQFENSKFDIITSFEVIEHLNTPNNEVRSIYNALRDGGLFYLTTPNYDSISRFLLGNKYNVISVPEHLCYYTSKTLDNLMMGHKFKKIKLTATGINIERLKNGVSSFGYRAIQRSNNTTEERIRVLTESNSLFNLLKSSANKILDKLTIGDALKGYYEKPIV